MNIIEAIQAAENGAFITNNFLQLRNHFLKYMKNGVFYQYELLDNGKTVFHYEVREFSVSEILSNGWGYLPIRTLNP